MDRVTVQILKGSTRAPTLLCSHIPNLNPKWGFPKIGGTLFGVLILRIRLFRVLYIRVPSLILIRPPRNTQGPVYSPQRTLKPSASTLKAMSRACAVLRFWRPPGRRPPHPLSRGERSLSVLYNGLVHIHIYIYIYIYIFICLFIYVGMYLFI